MADDKLNGTEGVKAVYLLSLPSARLGHRLTEEKSRGVSEKFLSGTGKKFLDTPLLFLSGGGRLMRKVAV